MWALALLGEEISVSTDRARWDARLVNVNLQLETTQSVERGLRNHPCTSRSHRRTRTHACSGAWDLAQA